MAWRLDEFLVRGEIHNRERGRVAGLLWFAGRAEPVELDLTGNAWRDLAGRRLTFTNPRPQGRLPAGVAARQTGAVGDITASRKVKVPDIPLEQIGEYAAAHQPFPWHWANALYLEWFGTANGRVVIETADYELTISGDATWEMTPDEEQAQRQANAEAIMQFMDQLGAAATPAEDKDPGLEEGDDAAQDEVRPQTEAEAERMLEESDRLADRIAARMEKEGPDADYAKILEEELERRRRERGEAPLTPEQAAERDAWIDEMNRLAEEAAGEAASEPWSPDESERKHPLAERAFELSLRLHQDVKAAGWRPAGASPEHPVAELLAGVMCASAKMAGALHGGEYPPPVIFCGQSIARLKRAASYLADALLAADSCAEEKLVDAAWLATARREIEALAAETEAVIAELRARLHRGWD